ncbi:uncharacterized protein A1O9_07589 [Exophiala aquamarina CBS 119918]|uniref:Uncharacterized protein n=1 Tax=Exophiala aquamarina CBS 119918 TaxID=1182545 RepID=A0A072P7B2_9EURO|nr:uncharacterized protein A1O9_07589 [Exophiala aquamarina CBS 119918]KEF56009.1 hypothetical protein A1O9_07589 [Exophiala aquamarina CBS 119918]
MASTQSWAAWLLDSYASSVSPVNSHPDEDTFSEPTTYTNSPSHSPMSSVSNSSAYGPYVRTGRGGAGNFTWQASDLAKSQSVSDLEAQKTPVPQVSSLSERRKAAAKLEHIDTQEALKMRQSSAQYLYAGRGGAGNYLSSNDIAQAKRSPSLPVTLGTVRPPSPSNAYSAHPGRGGAGNYAAAAEANGRKESEKEQEERIKAEQRREQIIVEVDGMLQPPPGAWLGGRRKSEAMHDDD